MTLVLAEPGEFPDFENVLMDMVSVIDVQGQQIGDRSGTRTPGLDENDALVDVPYFHIFRSNATGMNPQAWSDTAALYVAAWADSREEARQMIRGLRALIRSYSDGGDYKGVLIDRMWESGGPGPLPTEDEDDRRVETTVMIRAREHSGATVSS